MDDVEHIDHIDIHWNDGSIDQMDQIAAYDFSPAVYSGCYNLLISNARLTTFKDKNDLPDQTKPIERYIEEEQMIGRMAAISAVWTRIERGYSIDDLREFINEEREEYRKWFNKYRS